jgi:RHS repeat-associated protein
MARTAPVPNFPAIPGMNPGLFVLGGGGDGGGSGAGKGKGRAGKQGANGKNGGKDANGGGKNAGSCGAGSGAGCPNPQHGGGGSTAAGDPVDPLTGRAYTIAEADLVLPGPLPLFIERTYSTSAAEQDVGLGFGWMCSLHHRIHERRRHVRVVDPHGAPTSAPLPGMDESAELPCGTLTRSAGGYTLDARDGMLRVFSKEHAIEGEYVLSRIEDGNGNFIDIKYSGGLMTQVQDSAGRIIRVRRHGSGRIAAFEVKNAPSQGQWWALRRYEYNENGDLVEAIDASGARKQFTYDPEHRLVSVRHPGGLQVELRYDEHGRCVETWCHREGDDALDDTAPATLADGSRAKGFLHCRVDYTEDGSEVVTSRSVRRYEGNAFGKADKQVWGGGVHTSRFDAFGNVTEYTDALGSTWQSKRDDRGRLLAEIDPAGGVTELDYDARGAVSVMRTAAGAEVRYTRDDRGNILSVDDAAGNVVQYSYDSRGLMIEAVLPNGGVTRCAYDALGNRVAVTEPDGATRQIRYDFLGRVTAFVDPRGHETRFTYDPCGRLRTTRSATGATVTREYDADGNLVRVVDADGRATGLRWGGFHVVTEVVRPDGALVRYRYDREQELVRVVNEAGEEHRLTRDGEGRIVQERTFDGREIAYRHDLEGRIVRIDRGVNERTSFAYDPFGRLVERAHSDGRTERFEYDAVGRLVAAVNDETEVRYSHDARGNIVAEEVTAGDRRIAAIRSEVDALGRRTAVAPSAGPRVDVRRDIVGRALELRLDGEESLFFKRDAAGNEVERALPGGGHIRHEVDADGRVARIAVLGSGRRPAVGAGEPDWIGKLAGAETLLRQMGWSAGEDLSTILDQRGVVTEQGHDARGRVTVRERGGRTLEAFHHDVTGNPYEGPRGAATRTYGPGGRLLAKDGVRYVYDDLGRVVEKHVGEGEGARVFRFDWSTAGLLTAVTTPDERRVEIVYDAFARRVEKRVRKDGELLHVTRYTWDGDALVHEVREAARRDGDPVVLERSYAYLPGDVLPLAQRVRRGGAAAEPWSHYVHETSGLPDALIAGDGTVLSELGGSLFGKVAEDRAGATPLRFPGQVEDEETRLHGHRHRIYDPETGQFLTPEPLGLGGWLKPYTYVDAYPQKWTDVHALQRMRTTITRNDGSQITEMSGGRRRGDLHPAVQAALPPSPRAF